MGFRSVPVAHYDLGFVRAVQVACHASIALRGLAGGSVKACGDAEPDLPRAYGCSLRSSVV